MAVSSAVEHWADEAAKFVEGRLSASRLPLLPKHVVVYEDQDSHGESAWRVVLYLPAPAGDTWDRDAVFRARRSAVAALDALALDSGRVLPGSTVALVTTDEAAIEDTAPEDAPERGEDPGRDE